jgi:hypothetical protein
MSRIPRKKKKKIPKDTVYCYTPASSFVKLENGNYGYKIKSCPFYKHKEGLEGYCSLLKCEVIDQIKTCGERYGI